MKVNHVTSTTTYEHLEKFLKAVSIGSRWSRQSSLFLKHTSHDTMNFMADILGAAMLGLRKGYKNWEKQGLETKVYEEFPFLKEKQIYGLTGTCTWLDMCRGYYEVYCDINFKPNPKEWIQTDEPLTREELAMLVVWLYIGVQEQILLDKLNKGSQ